MKNLKVVFAGTPDFARVSLQALIDAGVRPVAVYTQPDRPKGRGRKLSACPVKLCAEQHGIAVHQPLTLKNSAAQSQLADLAPDLIVVAAYGLILPQAVLDIPKRGCLNVHASLLPRWRGAAPIQAAIIAGDADTGISLMKMEAGLDTGPVFARESLPIGATETAGELHDRLASLGGKMLAGKLQMIAAGEIAAKPQADDGITYAGKISTADSVLDWRLPAVQLHRRVRAYNPVPGARFEFDGELIKCWRSSVIDCDNAKPGAVIAAGKAGVDVACGDGALRLLDVQRAGRRAVTGEELAAQLPLSGRSLLPDVS